MEVYQRYLNNISLKIEAGLVFKSEAHINHKILVL